MKCFIDEDLPKCAGGKVQAQHRTRLKNWGSFPLWLAALANARASIKSHGDFTNWRTWYYYYLDWRSHEPWPNDNTFFLIFSFLFLTFFCFSFSFVIFYWFLKHNSRVGSVSCHKYAFGRLCWLVVPKWFSSVLFVHSMISAELVGSQWPIFLPFEFLAV